MMPEAMRRLAKPMLFCSALIWGTSFFIMKNALDAVPVFFLLAIGVSVLLNMGTNIFLGEVSYIAFTIAPILQLAVSLDYAIFLLHAFQRAREEEPDAVRAMRTAMRQSFSAIAASAATTLFGFAALGFMQFRIGADLGLTLCKGIAFSFLRVVVFLPAFTLVAYKLIDKTKHRRFLPTFKGVGKVLAPLRIPLAGMNRKYCPKGKQNRLVEVSITFTIFSPSNWKIHYLL